MKHHYKRALVVGGSSGIGLAVAGELVRRGCSVILVARRPEILQKAALSLKPMAPDGTDIQILSLDVSDSLAVTTKLPDFLLKTGIPDLLYNGAGTADAEHFLNITTHDFNKAMDINIGGVWNVLSAVVPLMKKAGKGHIVNVSSVAGLVGVYGYTSYSASKFAINGLSQCLRNELSPEGIRVQVLCPPDTDTPQLTRENLTKPAETVKIAGTAGIYQPEDIAKALIKGLQSRKFLIIPGFMSKLTWFLYRIVPNFVHFLIDADVRSVRNQAN
jgi:3-dehydrosphinganine reductase